MIIVTSFEELSSMNVEKADTIEALGSQDLCTRVKYLWNGFHRMTGGVKFLGCSSVYTNVTRIKKWGYTTWMYSRLFAWRYCYCHGLQAPKIKILIKNINHGEIVIIIITVFITLVRIITHVLSPKQYYKS